MRKRISTIALLILIIFLGIFARFFKLSDYPIQLNHDEASQLYDVVSIVQTGKDIYGNSLPLAFPSTGDFKVGHYIYITTLFYNLFGNNEVTIRLPAAFFGSLTILAVFLFVNTLTKNRALSLCCAFVIALTPSEIFFSRKSFENVIGVCLDFFGMYFLLRGINSNHSRSWGVIGIFLLSAAMYIYTSQTIIVPLLILLTISLYRKNLGRKKIFEFLAFASFLIVPLIILTLTNSDLRFRATSVFITQDQNLGRQIEFSGMPLKSYLDYIFTRFLNQFNFEFIFANGLDLTNQGLIGVGPLLFWQLPLLILGIICLLKYRDLIHSRNILFGMAIVAMIPSAITFEDFSPHRGMLSFSTLSIISSFGLYFLLKFFWRFEKVSYPIKVLVLFILGLSLALNITYSIHVYTVNYPYEKSEKMQYPFKKVAKYIWSEYDNFDSIVFDPQFGKDAPMIGAGAHYYLAYFGNYDPAKFQKEYRLGSKPREVIFDKFSIRQVYWPADKDLKNTLVIVSPWSVPEQDVDKSKVIKRFNFYDGELAFYAIKL